VDADGTVYRPLENDAAVVLDQFDEPRPNRATFAATTAIRAWRCRRDGGTCPGIGSEVAGMRDLVDAIRSTGARTVILADGYTPRRRPRSAADPSAHRPRGPSRRPARGRLPHLLPREPPELHALLGGPLVPRDDGTPTAHGIGLRAHLGALTTWHPQQPTPHQPTPATEKETRTHEP
jgi:hypothetical protein